MTKISFETIGTHPRGQALYGLVWFALADCEQGSKEWRWALTTALKLAEERGRGRPPDTHDEPTDEWWVMWWIYKATGETRPYKLAREAVATGQIPFNPIMTDEASVIRRLARLWENTSAERAWADAGAEAPR